MRAATALIAFLVALHGCSLIGLSRVPVRNEGNLLVDISGMTLYTFDRDPRGKSACDAKCTANWQPLAATAAAKGVGDYSVVPRGDGRKQWAYKGKPLYLWTKDREPGDRAGDGVDNLWRVARP